MKLPTLLFWIFCATALASEPCGVDAAQLVGTWNLKNNHGKVIETATYMEDGTYSRKFHNSHGELDATEKGAWEFHPMGKSDPTDDRLVTLSSGEGGRAHSDRIEFLGKDAFLIQGDFLYRRKSR